MPIFVFLVILGCLLPALGAILVISAIPITSWDASWGEIKEAFHVMFSNRRFQAGLACIAVGLLILLPILFL